MRLFKKTRMQSGPIYRYTSASCVTKMTLVRTGWSTMQNLFVEGTWREGDRANLKFLPPSLQQPLPLPLPINTKSSSNLMPIDHQLRHKSIALLRLKNEF